MLDVLEHIENSKEFMLNLKKILHIDSLVIIGVPAYDSLWSVHDEELLHFRRYNWQLLKEETKHYMILKKSYPKKKVFFAISGIFFFILLLLSFKPDLFFSFTSKSENNIISQLVLNNPMYQENVDQLIDFRVDEFKSSALQSLFFTILIFISVLALQYRKISQTIFVVIILLGVSSATFSISIPPSGEAITTKD